MIKIGLSGTHGSGKTTLVNYLTGKLKYCNINIGCMAETARTSPFILKGERSINTQTHIFFKQIELEILDKLSNYDIIVTDRTPIDMLAYTEIFSPENTQTIKMMHDVCSWYMQSYKWLFRTTYLHNLSKDKDSYRPKEADLQVKANNRIKELLDIYYSEYIDLPNNNIENISDFIIKKLLYKNEITLPNNVYKK